MSNCSIDSQEKFHNYLMSGFDKFKNLFGDIRSLDSSKQSLVEKMFVEELSSFYSLSCRILKSITRSEEEQCEEFKQMFYPVIRRLMERFFSFIYIFDEVSEASGKCKHYLNSIESQYNKMLKDLNDCPYRTEKLSKEMNKYNKENCFPGDVKSMLLKMKNDEGETLNYLYPLYRILSFYVHGNMSKVILDELSQNNEFAIIKVREIINLMANDYSYIISKIWPDILKNRGYELR